MSSLFLSPEISIGLVVEFLLLLVMSVAFLQSFSFMSKANLNQNEIDNLEKKSYLTYTLISVSLITKIILLLFFIYALDELSHIIPGAMCVTGVLDSNSYGTPLLLLKLSILLFISLWLLVESFKKKIFYFSIIYLFIMLEFILTIVFLSFIDLSAQVSCCSVKFVVEENNLPFGLSITQLLYSFFLSYLLLNISALLKQKYALLITNALFVYLAYYVIVYYFATYIYNDTSHKCPFCMLQDEYNFIGYFIYSSLFLSIFYSLSIIIFNNKYNYKKVQFFSFLTVFILSVYLLLDSV